MQKRKLGTTITDNVQEVRRLEGDFERVVLTEIDESEEFGPLREEIAKFSWLLGEDEQKVSDVVAWGVGHVGQLEMAQYIAANPTPETATREARFNQLTQLMEAEIKLVTAYPELVGHLNLVGVPYKDLHDHVMPSFHPQDTTPTRITFPHNVLEDKYGVGVSVGDDLLLALRGKKVQFSFSGIEYKKTTIGRLGRKSLAIGNVGLMLLADELYARPDLREMSDRSGVNCTGAGLAEGIVTCLESELPFGQAVGFPEFIPNMYGNHYSGVNFTREFADNPHSKPHLRFSLWTEEGAENCLLAVTAQF